MRRRTVLALAGAAGTAGLAGCLDDVLGSENGDEPEPEDDPDDGDSSGEGNQPEDDEEQTGDESEDDRDRSPEETVVAFYEAIADDDVERANELRHSDGIGPFEEEDLDGEPTVEETELVESDDETATVEALVVPDGAEGSVVSLVTLEREDGRWRIVAIGSPQEGDKTELTPNAAFETERENGSRQIIHTAGDHIKAANLHIRGDGIEETGSWTDLGGRASGTVGDEPAVTAGDSVTVGISDDYSISVVWEDGDTAVTLMEMAGASDSATESGDDGAESGNGGESDSDEANGDGETAESDTDSDEESGASDDE
ncbi:probable secreted glycoprotein [Natronomonas pharaonis DSM 2160]|uniref:Probable secreted glycoprotein n=1 Tax=Natronomonas pharaonis (strain ATCC 35678 / DSM 2160 / CIP 103997 / JCM 8858 / NBRC 14720 / NCIMB 2260 / Gabara) TaxID=348780 RepID=A0A1U7ETV0_NATPD|nr:cell surface glycoprotein [Natronomonas pharaonis]CAI48355.1 probable secreted glycoprotein [Natronomonas pharaonis DSM 2160]